MTLSDTLAAAATASLATLGLLSSYTWLNDRKIVPRPPPINQLGLQPITKEGVEDALRRMDEREEEMRRQMPPKTGRRYIVVGGGGSLGGWIVVHLLQRGEDPKSIRVIDLAPTPMNDTISEAIKNDGLDYISTSITDPEATREAFCAPWKDGKPGGATGITVFHTAAAIRFFEQHPVFLRRSSIVNVDGTRNVLEASKIAGVDVLVYTSSAGVSYKNFSSLRWPWEGPPRELYQHINEDTVGPRNPAEHTSNYSITKTAAERMVRGWDRTPVTDGSSGTKLLRTGCIRAGNAVFGPRGGTFVEGYLDRESTPTWTSNVVSSFLYVENGALAHLLYERRLLDLKEPTPAGRARTLPDIGGKSFCITDPGPPACYSDLYITFNTLTKGRVKFGHTSPTLMLLLAHLIRFYVLFQYFVTAFIPFLKGVLRPLQGDIAFLQPSAFTASLGHIIIDDSRARKSPEEGGLGYEGVWTTWQGFVKTWKDHEDRKQLKTGGKKASQASGWLGSGASWEK
ncbi:hypothetical protein CC1G_11332 [Coprinopsis cinerea okayama7|uniref:3-beta hydroxysteroid dehydrogenase/isomerase domain-containing protein n=1 Tax=Coprinopsis cinerea (strain Okayama-7 / 130 / ATCC MYA-4618 / FGSC 9003) TaxID=240176 RepID=A8P5S1_COPC7|nr:hypothetical protein CC1G_11332 [Coprinopsis cinerea okayama7\|eukprot:XP_001839009.1 hypothetical protein CC1G_11332 [Coprinopsis cinerea okayama7\